MAEIELTGRMSFYAIKPGDVLVIEVDHPVSMEGVVHIKRIAGERFPGHEIFVVEGRFHVLRKEHDAHSEHG